MVGKSPIKKIKKSGKKEWKKIVLIIMVSVITMSSILFITGLRIHFEIQDNLIIYLSPTDKSFTIANDQNQDITFNIRIDNSIFCKSNCSYIFYDRSEEKIIDNGSLLLKDKYYFNKTYQLRPYRRGSGQKIYNFDIQCSNIRSFLCTTTSLVRSRSSFITLNYELTKQEEKLKSELGPIITKSLILTNNASKNLQKSLYILDMANSLIEYGNFSDEYLVLLKNLSELSEQAKEISNLWSQENYIKLNLLYGKSLINQHSLLHEKSELLLSNILDSINKQNDLFKQYNELKNYFLNVSKTHGQYVYYSPSKENITNSFNMIYNYLKSINLTLSKKGYTSLFGFEEALIKLSSFIQEFNETLNRNYNLIILEGKNISSFEYSKKCYLGYCVNATDDACIALDAIFIEYHDNTYPTPLNTSIIDSPYYLKINDTIKILVSNDSREYYSKYCQNQNISYFLTDIQDIGRLNLIDISNIPTKELISNELTENPPLCCIHGKCSPCCTTEECKNDPSLFPVILIHGHSLLRKTSPEPLLDIFNKIQYQLQEEGYINAGTIRYNLDTADYNKNEWGLYRFPVIAKASYYYDYYYSLGDYIYITRNADNLDTYTVRLNDIIKIVKYKTGKPKVNIVAHSMGGLVARRYAQIFGEDSINKLILIATPNEGIEGDIKKFCHIFGEKRECEDMYNDGIFIKKLNDPHYNPNFKVYTISGKGCKTNGKDGDGIVTFESSLLDYATSYIISGTCDDASKKGLHGGLLNIDDYPEVYRYIKEILNND